MSVDPSAGGKFELVSSHWRWPDSDGVGCPENETPNMLATPDGDMQLDFTTNWGFIVAVDAAGSGNVTSSVKATTSQLAFDGFTSWSVAADGASLAGITPAAAQHGFCSDGCFQYGRESWPAGVYSAFRGPGCVLGGGRGVVVPRTGLVTVADTVPMRGRATAGLALVPFKAAMTNIAYLDAASNTYYFQGSYALESKWACSQVRRGANSRCRPPPFPNLTTRATFGMRVPALAPGSI